jgi:hypothetical protein
MADARTELQPSLLALPALPSFALQPLLPTASLFKNLFLLFCGQLESWFVNRVLCDEPCCSTSYPTVSSAGQPIQRSAAKTRILDVDRIRGMYRLGVSPDSRSAWRTRRSSARIAINSRRRSSLVIVRILKVRSRGLIYTMFLVI